VLMGVVICY